MTGLHTIVKAFTVHLINTI